MAVPSDLAYAKQLDAQDELASFQERFVNSDPGLLYLDGNSLGRLPKAAAERAAQVVEREWGDRLIRSWNEGWFTRPEEIGAKIAKLIGADPDEVIVADSTSINLFKLVVGALRYQQGRSRILSDNLNFPSDIYILQGAADLLGQKHQIELIASADGIYGPVAQIEAALDEQTALLSLSHTAFKSGYTYDMAALTAKAHDSGALVLWDLCHSVGAVPIDLKAAKADLAVGCTYKYLNGGPGAPAFLYVRRDLQVKIGNPLTGWMGQQNLFDFNLQYAPTQGIRRYLTGTPAVVSLSLIEAGVDLLLEAAMERLRAKSLRQSEYLIALWEQELAPLGFVLNSPREPELRGSHISLGHPEGLGIDLALINEMQVLPDFRPPDNLRLGIAPIYNSFSDIHATVMRLKQIVTEGIHLKYSNTKPTVT